MSHEHQYFGSGPIAGKPMQDLRTPVRLIRILKSESEAAANRVPSHNYPQIAFKVEYGVSDCSKPHLADL